MIPGFSVRKPHTIAAAFLALLLLAGAVLPQMTGMQMPQTGQCFVLVRTAVSEMTLEEAEQEVTRPIERALAAMEQIETVQSVTRADESIVAASMTSDAEWESIFVNVSQKLDQISFDFPGTVGKPVAEKVSSDSSAAIAVAIEAEGMDANELFSLVEEEITAAGAVIYGGSGQSLQIVLRPDKVEQANETVKNAVLAQLEEAKEALTEAKEALESGKQELEQQQAELEAGQIASDQSLLAGKLELLKQEISMSQSQASLEEKESQISQLEAMIPILENVIAQLEAQNAQSQSQIDEASASCSTRWAEYESEKEALLQEQAALQARLAEIADRLSQIGQTDGTEHPSEESSAPETSAEVPSQEASSEAETSDAEPSASDAESGEGSQVSEEMEALLQEQAQIGIRLTEIAARLAALELERTAIETERAALEESQRLLQESIDTASQARMQLNETKSQLESARAALNEARDALSAGQGIVSESQDRLNRQEEDAQKDLLDAIESMNQASSELADGEKTLEEQLAQFYEDQENTLNAANLDQIITTDLIRGLLEAQTVSQSAGAVTEDGVTYQVQVEGSQMTREDIETLVLFDPGIDGVDPICLEDVADISQADSAQSVDAKIHGNDCVIALVNRQGSSPDVQSVREFKEQCSLLEEQYSQIRVTTLIDSEEETEAMFREAFLQLALGIAWTVIAVMLLSGDLRQAIVTVCAIPASLLLTAGMMGVFNIALHRMSLSSLVLGSGMLSGSSVFAAEEMVRRKKSGISWKEAAGLEKQGNASCFSGAILSFLLGAGCFWLPLFFAQGMTGQLFGEAALTMCCLMVSSALVALTLIPIFVSFRKKEMRERKNPLLHWITRLYGRLNGWAVANRWIALLGAAALLAGGIVLAANKGLSLLPKTDGGNLLVSMDAAEEDREKIDEWVETVAQRLTDLDDVETVCAVSGAADEKTPSAVFSVALREDRKRSGKEMASQIELLCADLDCDISAFVIESDPQWNAQRSLSVRVEGNDWEVLRELAEEAEQIVNRIEGVESVSLVGTEQKTEVYVTVDAEKAMAHGLTTEQLYEQISEQTGAASLMEMSLDGEIDSIFVMDEGESLSMEDLSQLKLTAGTKETVLSEVASVELRQSPSEITRCNQERCLTMTVRLEDDARAAAVLAQIREELDGRETPLGYAWYIEGGYEDVIRAFVCGMEALFLGICAIYLLLLVHFQSFRTPLAAMTPILPATAGACVGAFFSGSQISAVTMIGGFMALCFAGSCGTALTTGIDSLRLEGIEKKDAILQAAADKMRPILLNTLTALAGCVLLAAGSDLFRPAALAAAGGIFAACLLCLPLVSAVYEIVR